MATPIGQVTFLGSFPRDFPATGLPEVAFAGRSNVGKSSALNCLLGRRALARVSRTPGRTQLVNLFRVDERFTVADLPGYGFAKVPDAVREGWKPMIEGYLGERDVLKLVVVLVDLRLSAQELDGALIYGLIESRIPWLVVGTKADKLGKQQIQRQRAKLRAELHLPPEQPIPFSAVSRAGREAVLDAIEAHLFPPTS
ncbi:MAG: ribosome biogenesis GTP-binding protein YihA/YsxC [Myxococcota bacterium]